MSLKERASNFVTKTCELPRVEWLLGLGTVPEQDDPVVDQMRRDLILGAQQSPADLVWVLKDQAIRMCDLMQLSPNKQQSIATPQD